jgi:hypothetical protein
MVVLEADIRQLEAEHNRGGVEKREAVNAGGGA